MEIEVLESKPNLLKLKLKMIDQGMLNAINDQIWQDKSVDMAGFRVTHPEVGYAEFTLRTKGKNAKTVWNDALKALDKSASNLLKQAKALK